MTRAHAFLAFLAVYFLARATGAHADEIAGSTDLPDGSDAGVVTEQDSPADLESVPVELSQMAMPVGEKVLLTDDRSPSSTEANAAVPAELAAETSGTVPAELTIATDATDAAGSPVAAANDAASSAAAEAFQSGPPQASLELPVPEFGGQNDAALISSAPPPDDALFATAGAQPVSDADLSEQRGGFVFQGVDIRLGAEIRSYIGDELVMQTNFNWTDAQANVERTVSTELTPTALADVQAGMLNGAGLSMKVGSDNVYVTNQGQTALVQRADGTLQNIILNSASNVVLRQQIDANLNLSNFAPFQNDIVSGRIVSALSSMASAALSMGTVR